MLVSKKEAANSKNLVSLLIKICGYQSNLHVRTYQRIVSPSKMHVSESINLLIRVVLQICTCI